MPPVLAGIGRLSFEAIVVGVGVIGSALACELRRGWVARGLREVESGLLDVAPLTCWREGARGAFLR